MDKLLEKGIAAIIIGVAFLAMPYFIQNPVLAAALAHGFRYPALIALVIGAVLIAVHTIARAKSQLQVPAPKKEPSWTSWAPPENVVTEQRNIPSAHELITGSSFRVVAPAGPQHEMAWSQRVFDQIEWRRFEAVCEKLFAQGGFETRTQSHGADGGVDIWLHSKNAEGPAAVVQCKHWAGKQVGVKEVREFFGVMSSHKLKRGTFATSSTFSADALQFAKENGINAMHGDRLLDLIAKRSPHQQAELLAVAYEGEYWRPTCARCGTKMVERQSKKENLNFWGCTHYPRCKSTLPIRRDATVSDTPFSLPPVPKHPQSGYDRPQTGSTSSPYPASATILL